eukprot:1188818-Prorocentrum_minimum.AAC.6
MSVLVRVLQLEGIALVGDPNYNLVKSAVPAAAKVKTRKLPLGPLTRHLTRLTNSTLPGNLVAEKGSSARRVTIRRFARQWSPHLDGGGSPRGRRRRTEYSSPRPITAAYMQNIPYPDQSRWHIYRIFLTPTDRIVIINPPPSSWGRRRRRLSRGILSYRTPVKTFARRFAAESFDFSPEMRRLLRRR